MSELSFLLELLLNHKLPKATQLAIKDRIGEVELAQPVQLKNMAKTVNIPVEAPNTAVVVASPQAAEAMAARQRAIAIANSDKPEPGRTSPRKF